jgi:hypothetical protein
MNNNDKKIRYPEAREDYTTNMGIVGEFAPLVALEDLGYEVSFLHHPKANGVDIKTGDIGIEVWNHSDPHIYQDRIDSVKKNLEAFTYKYIITSFIAKPVQTQLESCGIDPIVTGFQILVNNEEYKEFYKNEKGKKFFNHHTIKIVQNMLKSKLPKPKLSKTKLTKSKSSKEINYTPIPAYVYTRTFSVSSCGLDEVSFLGSVSLKPKVQNKIPETKKLTKKAGKTNNSLLHKSPTLSEKTLKELREKQSRNRITHKIRENLKYMPSCKTCTKYEKCTDLNKKRESLKCLGQRAYFFYKDYLDKYWYNKSNENYYEPLFDINIPLYEPIDEISKLFWEKLRRAKARLPKRRTKANRFERKRKVPETHQIELRFTTIENNDQNRN